MYKNFLKTQLFALKSQPGRRSKYTSKRAIRAREQTFASIRERRRSSWFSHGGQWQL
jgi:hypothetical protein